MMILLFVSGLSIVRSEEAPDSGKMKGLLKKLTEKKNMKTQKIQATCTPTSSYQYLGFSYYTCYDLSSCPGSTCTSIEYTNGVSCCTEYKDANYYDDLFFFDDDDPSALTVCVFMGTLCNFWSSPTGLFSLTYTNNNGGTSTSVVISNSALTQLITNPNSFNLANTINTEDLYICTGTYDSSADDIIAAYGGCDLSKKSVDSGETYYFISDSLNYEWSISYPLGDGAIAGIVIGVLLFLGCCCGGCLALIIMSNRKKKAQSQPQTTVIALTPGQTQQNPTVVTTNAV
jgi:hypothetical protein